MTLRELAVMAAAKQRADWYRAAVMTANLMRMQAAKGGEINPLRLIPPAYRPPKPRARVPAEQQREDTRRVLDALEAMATRKK